MINSAELLTDRNPITIKIIGLGTAGANLVDHFATPDLAAWSVAVVHTNARALEAARCAEKLLIGTKLLRGLGTGGDPDMGKASADEEIDELKALCAGADLVLIATGLGGGTGTGVGPVLARAAKESGALVLGIVALPFEFEGSRRQRQAQAGLQRLRGSADGVVCLSNEKVCRLLQESTRAVEVFGAANELWAEGARAILKMLTRRGLINVDFADLVSVVRDRHAQSWFATVQAGGEARSRAVVEKLLAHPFLDGGQALADADALLVTLTGGPDLTMTEINWVLDQLRRQPDSANVVVGAGIDEKMMGQLSATIIASKHDEMEHGPVSASRDEEESELGHGTVETQFFGTASSPRPPSRCIPPPPELSAEKKDELFAQQKGKRSRMRKAVSKWKQSQLPLEIVSKGRFEKSEPTIHDGEDLDVPTYIRRGIRLN